MKRIISLLILIALVCPTMVMAAADTELTFGVKDLYLSEEPLSGFPATVEATVKLPSDLTARAGTIIGNYTKTGAPCFTFEIYSNGIPRLMITGKNKKQLDLRFKKVNVCTDDWVNVAIVTDVAAAAAYCYIDGVLKQTITNAAYPTMVDITAKLALGGDQRSGNAQYFKGSIKNLRLYNDVRSAEEIASDRSSTVPDADGLLAAYDIAHSADGSRPSEIRDLSDGSNHVYHHTHSWSRFRAGEVAPLEKYGYSMAVIGDTSVLSKSYPKEYNVLYSWLLEHSAEQNIRFVFGLGDITSDGYAEYALADANFMNLNERIPFSFVRGDRDTAERFDELFRLDRYDDQVDGSLDGTMRNTYRKFEAGRVKYLALSLDTEASDEVIARANEICRKNPDRNVIVSTHAYLDGSGNILPGRASVGTNTGANLWNKLIRLHKNISMVLCGHADTPNGIALSKRYGVSGNAVTQLLVNPAKLDSLMRGAGIVAMLYFSEDGRNVQLRYYSTVYDTYILDDNQLSFSVGTVEQKP